MLYKDGHEFILEYMGRGAITGEGAAFDGQPRFSAAVAMEPTEVVRFEAPVVLAAFPTNPELASSLLEVAALKQRILAKRAQTLSTHHPTRRIAEVLLRLAQTYGRPTARGLLIDTRLTHTTLAAMTGTSRVTVTRTLRRLAQSGTIELVSRAIRVCCLDELHRLASS